MDWQESLLLRSQSKRKGFGVGETQRGTRELRIRIRMLWGICLVILAVILARVVYLQIFESGQHVLLAESNHIELIRQEAPRGSILDRNGVPIAQSQPAGEHFQRVYPLGPAGASVVGYMSEVTETELGCRDGMCYEPGMSIGRAGLERTMEPVLRGKDGGRLVEVDARGQEVRELGSNPAEPGEDVTLSIDSRLEQMMYNALGGRRGSAVALDMQGKVLGMVSSPSYDPANIAKYLSDTQEHYFLNRAISGTYPPGSVFKLVTSYAGLATGSINLDTTFDDTGEIRVGQYRYGNWYFDQYGRTEGKIGLVKAISRSNDIFFYRVGEATGVDNLVAWARKFGLGQGTGIELPGEAGGLVPDRLQKERSTGEKWFLGNTYHLAIGQGDLLVTPAQVARMTIGAVSGRNCALSLQKDSEVNCTDLPLSTEQLTAVRAGMQGACDPGGTAFPFFGFQPPVLCKTGTAQVGGPSDSDKADAWITVAYPASNPKLVLTVMFEQAGEGSYEAGPVAKSILEQWRDLGN